MKESVLKSERVLLNTISYDLNIEHAYEPVVELIKRLRRTGTSRALPSRCKQRTFVMPGRDHEPRTSVVARRSHRRE